MRADGVSYLHRDNDDGDEYFHHKCIGNKVVDVRPQGASDADGHQEDDVQTE